jgi:hypothetical protein
MKGQDIAWSSPPQARSFELKLRRAEYHLKNVGEQVEGWREACYETASEEPNPEYPGYCSAWIDAPALDYRLLTLRFGDAIQCLRSALDHLAFELALAFTVRMTNDVERDSGFPILSDVDRRGALGQGPAKWRASGHVKVRALDPAAQTVIEQLQPYHRGHAFETDPLWVLATLNNIDKHRALHVLTRVMSGATFPLSRVAMKLLGGNVYVMGGIAAEGRTEVARWPAEITGPGQVQVGFRPRLDVVFDPSTPLVGGETLASGWDLYDYVVRDVVPKLAPFLEQG